jgi:WD40 repeat protein
MKPSETDDIELFRPSFDSKPSLVDLFDRNLGGLKSIGTFNLSDREESHARSVGSTATIPSKEYLLQVSGQGSTAKNQHMLSQKYSVKLEAEVMCVRFNTTGTLLGCGLNNGGVAIIDNNTSTILKELSASTLSFSVNSVRWKPNVLGAQILNAVSSDGNIVSFDVLQHKFVCTETPRRDTQLLCSDYNAEGKLLALGTEKGDIILWDDFTHKVERVLDSSSWFNNGHSNRIFSVKFVNDEPNMLLSGGWDRAVFLWDIRDPKVG